jgi:sugar/nucleoside kinase (ribokinase family)/nucleoside 2-deoxyribosyltransferase
VTDVVVIGGIYRELLPPASRPLRRAGGSGFVAALTAARLGADVALISYVGEQDARSALSPLKRAGVDVSAVTRLPGVSGVFQLTDLTDRRAPRPGYRPAESLPSPEQLAAPVPTAPIVLAFGFPGFTPMPWIQSALEEGGTLLWDRQGWLSREIDRLDLRELPAERRVYVANLEEMRAEANQPTYAAALLNQPAAGFDAALIKCGRWGTLAIEKLVVDEGRVDLIPAFLCKPEGIIGSGDSFVGAVASRLAQGDTLGEAATVGAAAASLFVRRSDNIPPTTLAAGVEQLLKTGPKRFVSPGVLEKVRVYLGGPWFTAAERLLIDELEAALENLGVADISPRRDIGQLPADATPEEALAIGQRDYAEIEKCHLIVAVLDGDDAGTLLEVGYAARAGKPIIALHSLPDVVPQPMREAAGIRVARSVGALLDEVTEWVRNHRGIG